jgi:phosphatidylserine decarboxylase
LNILFGSFIEKIRKYKSPKYYDVILKQEKEEKRTWMNAIVIWVQQSGLFPIDGYIYKYMAKLLLVQFNKANDLFRDTGKNPIKEVLKFANKHEIECDLSNWKWSKPLYEYTCINDFFMRRYETYNFGNADIVTPACATCKQFQNFDSINELIKGNKYTRDNSGIPNINEFSSTKCFYFYLSVSDYHCFHSPVSGIIENIVDCRNTEKMSCSVKVDLLEGQKSLFENRRYIIVISRKNDIKIALMIIGGFMVDSIRIDDSIRINKPIKKGQYIGAFALGGSAILMLTNKDIKLNDEFNDISIKDIPYKMPVGYNFADFGI